MGCYNSVKVGAPINEVWTALRNFHDMSWAPHVIENLEPVGKISASKSGAKRVLNGAFRETLLALDDAKHCFRYSIDDGPDVLSKDKIKGYVGEVTALEITEDNTTLVTWSSEWEVGGTEVTEFCDPIYKALLGELKQSLSK